MLQFFHQAALPFVRDPLQFVDDKLAPLGFVEAACLLFHGLGVVLFVHHNDDAEQVLRGVALLQCRPKVGADFVVGVVLRE